MAILNQMGKYPMHGGQGPISISKCCLRLATLSLQWKSPCLERKRPKIMPPQIQNGNRKWHHKNPPPHCVTKFPFPTTIVNYSIKFHSWSTYQFFIPCNLLNMWHYYAYILYSQQHIQTQQTHKVMILMFCVVTLTRFHWIITITVTSHDCPGASNHQLDSLFYSLFNVTTKNIPKIHITSPLWGESADD